MSHRLPDSWIKKIFVTLQSNYGTKWVSMWASREILPNGMDAGMALAMDTWADKLGVFEPRPEAIKWALNHLPADPPSLPAFVELCTRAPRGDRFSLSLPAPEISPEERAKRIEMITQWKNGKTDHTAWWRKILANPGRYPAISVEFAKEAEQNHQNTAQTD
jgi:hypothetical protein